MSAAAPPASTKSRSHVIDGSWVEPPGDDKFVQAGTNLSSFRLAHEIERRHGRPRIAINAATVAHALRELGIDDPRPAAGSVLALALPA